MKKIMIAAVLVVSAVAGAPKTEAAVIEKGILLGMNISRLSGRTMDLDWKAKSGFTGGLVLTFALTDFFALQPGVFYSQKGALYEEPYEGQTLRTAMRLSYLDFPLVARLSLPLGFEGSVRPYILGGASYSLKMGAKLRAVLIGDYETPIDEVELTGFKKGGGNLVLGAGVDLAVQSGRIVFEGRYSRSLGTISTEGEDVGISLLSILVGFAF
jgi:hypothetical protein